MKVTADKNGFHVTAYRGDAKTLLAFNLSAQKAKNLAGFTLSYVAGVKGPYYLQNTLRFKDPTAHAQDPSQPPNSSLNAPLHRFRWIHVPGSFAQGTQPFFGPYTYTATPRYFDAHGSMLPIDAALSVSVQIEVSPFTKGKLTIGNTRGFVQSQAFVHHFGPKAVISPPNADLLFDTSQMAGTDPRGRKFSFVDEYRWLGFTARDRVFSLLNTVVNNPALRLDVFAYDLDEPDVMRILLQLATEGRVRVILDNASLHHDATGKQSEDQFEARFKIAAIPPAAILRGHFSRYSHDKILIVSDSAGPVRALTGSTNFSLTGLYVNSNHVLIFEDRKVATVYSQIFNSVWGSGASIQFSNTANAAQAFSFSGDGVPRTSVTFSPHPAAFAQTTLNAIAARISQESSRTTGNVLFAVMALDTGTGAVLPALREIHSSATVFSYGISDTPGGIFLYPIGEKRGVLVTGKPVNTQLPPPFSREPRVVGHQIHHKFIVCGFNGPQPIVYCGSSNLTELGEQQNGDNLLAISDRDVVTVFAIEALSLVDHFNFLDREAAPSPTPLPAPGPDPTPSDTTEPEWFLSTTDRWTKPYYDPNDLHSVDRELFG